MKAVRGVRTHRHFYAQLPRLDDRNLGRRISPPRFFYEGGILGKHVAWQAARVEPGNGGAEDNALFAHQKQDLLIDKLARVEREHPRLDDEHGHDAALGHADGAERADLARALADGHEEAVHHADDDDDHADREHGQGGDAVSEIRDREGHRGLRRLIQLEAPRVGRRVRIALRAVREPVLAVVLDRVDAVRDQAGLAA